MLCKCKAKISHEEHEEKAKICAEENAGVGFSVLNVIDYSYDSLSRLIEADYNKGTSVLNYGYDVAGNMVDLDGTSRTFNAVNQMTNDGTNTLTYDNNGNLRTVGSDTYTWDRANRLLSVGNHSYVYDGLGNRVQQTVSSVVIDYLNDVQPALTKLLAQSTGANVDRFVHGVRGIHAVDDGIDWNFYANDGLGSVRALMDDASVVQSSMSYDPYGMPLGTNPSEYDFGFTGEQMDANGSVFLRARYYEPSMGTFIKQDPAETPNRYGYVSGNVVNRVDPTGLQDEGIWGWLHEQVAQEMVSFNNSVATVHDVANRVSTTTRQLGALSNVFVQDTNAFISNPCNLVGDPADPHNLSAISTWFIESGVRFVSEPHDWGYTINDWRQGNFHPIDLAGFLPLVPALSSLRRTQVDDFVVSAINADIHRVHQIAEITPANLEDVINIPRLELPDGSTLHYRGQQNPSDAILSIIAQQDGTPSSRNLYDSMINNGYTPSDIAYITGSGFHGIEPEYSMIDRNLLLPQYQQPLNINPSLGNVGIPTSLNPGVAAHFARESGVIYVIRYPNNNPSHLTLPPAQVPATSSVFSNPLNIGLQLAEEEWVFFNQIPNEYVIGSIEIGSVPQLRISTNGNGLSIIRP